jgi:uncharacterized membrane protein YkoI
VATFGGTLGTQAETDTAPISRSPASIVSSARATAQTLARLDGIEDDETRAGDGMDLLPQAKLTFEQAAQAAQTAAPGTVGEVDLEYDENRLVFDVDVDGHSVKVDAITITGQGLAAEAVAGDNN